MHPVQKRILVHGALTAGVLALVGLLFAELAGLWASGNAGRPTASDLNPQLPAALRYRVPLTLALGGFLFVTVGELIAWRIRRNKKPAAGANPTEPPPDDVEKLLNDLLAQAEAKMAEQKGQEPADRSQDTADKKEEGGSGDKKVGDSARPGAAKPPPV